MVCAAYSTRRTCAQYGSVPVAGQADDHGTLWRYGSSSKVYLHDAAERGFNFEFREHMKMCARSRTRWTPGRKCSGRKRTNLRSGNANARPAAPAPGGDRRPGARRTRTQYAAMYAASVADPDAFWGEHGQAARLDRALHPGQAHLLRLPQRLDQVVRGRQAQRLRQLHRPPPRHPRRPDRDHLGERRPARSRSTSATASCTSRSRSSATCCTASA